MCTAVRAFYLPEYTVTELTEESELKVTWLQNVCIYFQSNIQAYLNLLNDWWLCSINKRHTAYFSIRYLSSFHFNVFIGLAENFYNIFTLFPPLCFSGSYQIQVHCCKYCRDNGKKFSAKSKRGLLQHINQVHELQRANEHECPQCNKTYMRPSELNRHLKKCTPALKKSESYTFW